MVGEISENKTCPMQLAKVTQREAGTTNTNLACTHREDEYISTASNNSESSNQSLFSTTVSLFSDIGCKISRAFDILSPILDFTKNFSQSNNNVQQEDKERLVKDFSELLNGAKENLGGLISNESKNALDKLAEVVSEAQNGNTNVDLGSIIARWRETRDAQLLIRMAEHLENGNCSSLNESQARELRQALVRSLRTLSRAIENAEERGEQQALSHLHSAANPIVDSVERAHEASQRDNTSLTLEDRGFIGERLSQSHHIIDEGLRTGVFNNLDCSIIQDLIEWNDLILKFLHDFIEEVEKARKREEEIAQCEKRHEMERKAEDLHIRHIRAENEKIFYRTLKRKAEQEILILKMLARARGRNINMTTEHIRYHSAESMEQSMANRETALINEEYEVDASMPSAEACSSEYINGFTPSSDFDVHC